MAIEQFFGMQCFISLFGAYDRGEGLHNGEKQLVLLVLCKGVLSICRVSVCHTPAITAKSVQY